MENNNLERNIRRMFEQHHPDLNTDEIWDNIEPHLKQKKKRRFLFFWFLFGGLAIGWMLWPSENNALAEIKQNHSTESITAPQAPVNLNQQVPASSVGQEQAPDKTLTTPSSSDLKSTTTHDLTNKIQNNFLTSSRTKTVSVQNQEVLNSTKDITSFNQKKTEELKNKNPNSEAANARPKTLNENLVDTKEKSTLKLGTVEANRPITTDEITDNSLLETTDQEAALLLNKNTSTQKATKKKAKKKSTKKRKKKKKKKAIKPLSKKIWESQLQTSVAPILPIKILKQNVGVDIISPAYVNDRKKSETQLEAFSIYLGAHFQHRRKGLLIATALEYRQYNERFDRYEKTTLVETKTGVLTITENAAGAVINSASGLKVIETTITEHQEIYNNHRFLSIPIGLGKAWNKRKSKNSYKLLGGLDCNFYHAFKGTVYRPDLNPVDLSKSSAYYKTVFKSTAGFGLWLSGEYNRAINTRLSWLIAPKIQLPMSSLTQDDFAVSQKYYTLSLDVGINYLLNPKKVKK